MALNDGYGRLGQRPDRQAERRADGARWVEGRTTHLRLAALLGCPREMAGRRTKHLERGGNVRIDADRVWLAPTLPARG